MAGPAFVWTQRVHPAPTNFSSWRAVFGNGRFVMCNNGLTNAIWSTDGISWNVSTGANVAQPQGALGFGNGYFVSLPPVTVAAAGTRSTDGSVWSTTSNPGGNWVSIAFGNGTFVATGTSTATSPDGAFWTAQTSVGNSVVFGNGMFVVANMATYNRSTDGINWQSATGPAIVNANVGNDGVFGNGKFIFTSANGALAISSDGINWTSSTVGFSTGGDTIRLAYGNGLFVAVGAGAISGGTGTQTAISTDGLTWTPVTPANTSAGWRALAFGNGIFACGGMTLGPTGALQSAGWTGGMIPGSAQIAG